MRVGALTSPLLDYWVARAEGWIDDPNHPGHMVRSQPGDIYYIIPGNCEVPKRHWFLPAVEWEFGGPFIDREGISLKCCDDGSWYAYKGDYTASGKTALESAMRCYVKMKFGPEVND